MGQSWQFIIANKKVMSEIEILKNEFDNEIKRLQIKFEEKVEKIQDGDELLPGVLKMVKVFVAVKENYNLEIKWLEGMVIKVLFLKYL